MRLLNSLGLSGVANCGVDVGGFAADATKELYTRWITLGCLLYTSDAADERSSVDLGGRRIIKKKQIKEQWTYDNDCITKS